MYLFILDAEGKTHDLQITHSDCDGAAVKLSSCDDVVGDAVEDFLGEEAVKYTCVCVCVCVCVSHGGIRGRRVLKEREDGVCVA